MEQYLTRNDKPESKALTERILAKLVISIETLALHLMHGTHLPEGVQCGGEGQDLQEDSRSPGEVH